MGLGGGYIGIMGKNMETTVCVCVYTYICTIYTYSRVFNLGLGVQGLGFI